MSEIEAPARGEYLIRGGAVLSMDPGIGILERGDVHVRDGAIVAVERRAASRRRAPRSSRPRA